MAQSLAQVYLHIVFSTKNRQPFIQPNVSNELYAYISGYLKILKAMPVQINGMEDHVHILTTFPRTITIADLLREIKSNSSRWIKTKGEEYKDFEWQDGYGVFSVSSSQKSIVTAYIANQQGHHRKQSFQEEFLECLQKNDVSYNEKYLWD